MRGQTSVQIEGEPIPIRHVAIIPDGNRRWARKRGLRPMAGHRAGVDRCEEIVSTALDLGIPYLTLFAFSSENWQRVPAEVTFLMGILESFIDQRFERLKARGVSLRVLGDLRRAPVRLQQKLRDAERRTKAQADMTLNMAFSYGGRDELVRAMRGIAERVGRGEISADEIDEHLVSDALDTAGEPDPDLVIRTSGESRLSNFLTWQATYSELYFTETLWPDFDRLQFEQALEWYGQRERRYGGDGQALLSVVEERA